MKWLLFFSLIFSCTPEISGAADIGPAWKTAKAGRYTLKISDLSERWSAAASAINVNEKSNELKLIGIRTPDDSTYVGIMAKTVVRSNLTELLKILRHVDGYTNIYPGLDEVKSVKTQDDFEIHWKFSGPMGSHTVYDTVQRVVQINPTKGLLVYQLKESNDVVETDGFIFMQQEGETTKYLSVDFFNAKWGIAGTFFKNKIWETSFDNTKRATLQIKEQAEKSALPSATHPETVSVNYVGRDDRATQKTFESLEAEIFGTGISAQPGSR